MPALMPPQPAVQPPALVAPAPACRYLSNSEAQAAFERLRASLPSTQFDGAQPSEICGLVRVQLANGSAAYTDATGRYFLLAFALDTHRGSPADNSQQLEDAIQKRQAFPAEAIPGVMPSPAPQN
ncbi:hypothetical protein DIE18_02030 [Burkholderia sp. Bp9125]|nr:hypothetical protein DIE18_02030 [Burkholderia sp. Bp9125]